ncbi:MAG TPA: TIGR04255 family protein [Acidimicrobiales bacterium]|nr:TIGR04255 family protein [Acidimicrobiales bacterium]
MSDIEAPSTTPAELLPRYEHPPVSEVVMSVQFDPITALTPVHLGQWWTGERRQRYPHSEERPPIEPAREEFGPPTGATFSFQLSAAPSPAIWFFGQGRDELLQVQRDRFTRNWTRSSSEVPYPSYDALRPRFASDLQEFSEFVQGAGLGQLAYNQAELTYINPIRPNDAWARHSDVAGMLAPWSGDYSDGFLGDPEDLQLALRYPFDDEHGQRCGRLLVSLKPVYELVGQPVYLLTLTARGRPPGPGVEGTLRFLDVAHRWIVKGFTTLTTEPMHEAWGRTQ